MLLIAVSAASQAQVPKPAPRCFGAAAADPRHPCRNPKLTYSVVPVPMDALITPDAGCTLTADDGVFSVCSFGVPPAAAKSKIALVGDSHAADQRAALEGVAKVKRWRGVSLTRSSCTFSESVRSLPEPGRSQCIQWTEAVIQWFIRHPDVNTVFVAEHARGSVVVPRGGQVFAAEIDGYIAAWQQLPSSVKHIIVIRDTPQVGRNALVCVENAIASRERAGVVCAVPRRRALAADPAVVAATRLRSRRVQVIDFTRQLCGTRLCYPVIGGALVYKDGDHLTSVFDRTLVPFVLRQVGTLMKAWPRRPGHARVPSRRKLPASRRAATVPMPT